MEQKPTLVHVIDSLGRGGAETLLVTLLPALNEQYNVVLVTLTPENDFGDDKIVCFKRYCLHYRGTVSIVTCAMRLRKIINKHEPVLVRSQLYLSSVIARLATPKNVPLVFSIHNPMSVDSYRKNRFALPLEKLTYYKNHHLISVSKDALTDFDQHIGVKGPSYILYNFINQKYIEKAEVKTGFDYRRLRLVAVGNLKTQKNFDYLVEAFKKLKEHNVSLDIYGDGDQKQALQSEIDKHDLRIVLKGRCKDVYNILPEYDLYVLPSKYEGFGIAIIEAMAIGLPLLLSDLPVLREVTHNNALFFNSSSPDDFVRLIQEVMAGKHNLEALSRQGIEIAKENYQQKDYLPKLNAIYRQVISKR